MSEQKQSCGDRRQRLSSPTPHHPSNVRALSAFKEVPEYDEDDEGAYIPDIPPRRYNDPADAGYNMLDQLNSDSSVPRSRSRRASGSHVLHRHHRRMSTTSNPEDGPATPEVEDSQDAGTRSPSTVHRSVMSHSMRSRPASSVSSMAPPTSLPALQTKGGPDSDGLEPLAEEEIDPASFDLVVPAHGAGSQYALETRSELLFSVDHLKMIIADPILLQRFTNFLWATRSSSIPLLTYYLDALKAIRAIEYANSISNALARVHGQDFSSESIANTANDSLREQADRSLIALAREDLPAYITHTWIKTVSVTIKRRISDTLPTHLRDMSEGLAEVFCLTDPSRPDNPIVFASEEFHRTTQYGMNYVLGRNCRFLQGPKTNQDSTRRIRERLAAGKEHCETFLNYRRDGSPFMNLLMVAPLYDSRGIVRYHIGAQVDVSGLAKDCSGLESLERLVAKDDPPSTTEVHDYADEDSGIAADEKDEIQKVEGANEEDSEESQGDQPVVRSKSGVEFQALAEMLSLDELKTVREHGGSMHRTHQEELGDADHSLSNWNRPRVLIRDDDAAMERRLSDPVSSVFHYQPEEGRSDDPNQRHYDTLSMLHATPHSGPGPSPMSGRLAGVYQHYLLVRPHPSLKVLFASPSLRVPGMLQSDFLSRIGGSRGVRDAIADAMSQGCGVTAKVRWLSSVSNPPLPSRSSKRTTKGNDNQDGNGRGRWIHCTPLLGANGAVGVWMVILVDEESTSSAMGSGPRGIRDAPPVSRHIGPSKKPSEFDLYAPPPTGDVQRVIPGPRNSSRQGGGGGTVRFHDQPSVQSPQDENTPGGESSDNVSLGVSGYFPPDNTTTPRNNGKSLPPTPQTRNSSQQKQYNTPPSATTSAGASIVASSTPRKAGNPPPVQHHRSPAVSSSSPASQQQQQQQSSASTSTKPAYNLKAPPPIHTPPEWRGGANGRGGGFSGSGSSSTRPNRPPPSSPGAGPRTPTSPTFYTPQQLTMLERNNVGAVKETRRAEMSSKRQDSVGTMGTTGTVDTVAL